MTWYVYEFNLIKQWSKIQIFVCVSKLFSKKYIHKYIDRYSRYICINIYICVHIVINKMPSS